jgi:hypothetical protein
MSITLEGRTLEGWKTSNTCREEIKTDAFLLALILSWM